jgi:hypothetical protein
MLALFDPARLLSRRLTRGETPEGWPRRSIRPDDDARRALAVLTQDGTPVSTAVRAALIQAAKTAAQVRLRAEAAALAADEADRAEAAQVLRDTETLRAW